MAGGGPLLEMCLFHYRLQRKFRVNHGRSPRGAPHSGHRSEEGEEREEEEEREGRRGGGRRGKEEGGPYLGFSSGSGSLRPSPTGPFSASSPVMRCSSASTLPCERDVVQGTIVR